MAYSSASGVSVWTKNILGPNKVFTQSTCPTLQQVNGFLSSGCSVLEIHLTSRGYAIPVASTAIAYGWIRDLEELWGAAHVEFSRTVTTLAPGETTRGQVFTELFWDQLDRISKLDLSGAGVSVAAGGRIYVGGISRTEKQVFESNSDMVGARFYRGLGRFPGAIDPTVNTASRR